MREGWLETELFSIQQERGAGDWSRKIWREHAKANPGWWKELPRWFKVEARPFLDPKWKPPKPKQPHPQITEILKAIEEASHNEQT